MQRAGGCRCCGLDGREQNAGVLATLPAAGWHPHAERASIGLPHVARGAVVRERDRERDVLAVCRPRR